MTRWSIGEGRSLDLQRTAVMGILNVTPDSFSDGGRFINVDSAVAHAFQMLEQGADLLDVGGESTRPGADAVGADEEMSRVVPVIEEITRRTDAPISVDTSKAAVANAALSAGATIVNDISGLEADSRMAGIIAEHGAGVVLMHMRGSPRTMQSHASYENLCEEVAGELQRSIEGALSAGIALERVVIDPGIGFSKTPKQNLEIIKNLGALLSALGRPVLVGPSRKSFIGAVTGAPVHDRLPGTLAAVVYSVLAGARVVRVHDVAKTTQALQVVEAIQDTGDSSTGSD